MSPDADLARSGRGFRELEGCSLPESCGECEMFGNTTRTTSSAMWIRACRSPTSPTVVAPNGCRTRRASKGRCRRSGPGHEGRGTIGGSRPWYCVSGVPGSLVGDSW